MMMTMREKATQYTHTEKKKSITLFANLRSLVAQWCGSVVVGFFFIAVSNRL